MSMWPAATRNSYIEEAGRLLGKKSNFRRDTAISWSGQYESMHRVKERLNRRCPLHALPGPDPPLPEYAIDHQDSDRIAGGTFLAIGAFWFLYLLGYT